MFNEIPSFLGHTATEWKHTDKRAEKNVCWHAKLIKNPFIYSYSIQKKTNYVVRPLICANLLSFSYGFRNRNIDMIYICLSAFCRENIFFDWSEVVFPMYVMSTSRPPEKLLRKRKPFKICPTLCFPNYLIQTHFSRSMKVMPKSLVNIGSSHSRRFHHTGLKLYFGCLVHFCASIHTFGPKGDPKFISNY